MEKIWLTSDTHFGHDREFIWGPRGFKNVWENDKIIIENWNSVVGPDDDVYHLGDIMLGDNEHGIRCLNQLKGNIHIIRGNHDTDTRMNLYGHCWNVVELCEAKYLKYGKYSFYLSHYPTITTNLDDHGKLSRMLLNLYGHTHQKTNFYNEMPGCYHVGVDSHNCTPVLLDDIIKDIKKKIEECKKYL